MKQIESILGVVLWLHIMGGTLALLAGLGAMFTAKGGTNHRRFGKIYFWSMTTVFVSAVCLSIGHNKMFLLMIAFFSYFFTARGYRILHLKGLGRSQKAGMVDWLIVTVAAIFAVFLFGWGAFTFARGATIGLVAIVFGVIGSVFVSRDIRTFRGVPESRHWWYSHIASMGGSYISAFTAFIVVNVNIPGFGWVLWLLPSAVGGVLIARTVRKYRVKFAAG